ncbi:MAG: S-methyl-5-thioribose-1-phosphate isomerase [Candidatus Thermoplasmatota archaeon]
MKVEGREYRSVWFENNLVKFIDQRKLPYSFEIFTAKTVDHIAFAIKDMVVRGAPAIGAAAAYGMVLGKKEVHETVEKLRSTRPTAYDLFYALDYMKKKITAGENACDAAERYVEDIISQCKKIGEYGEKIIKDDMRILTHCNAGALATVDYGTALSPLRCAYRNGKKLFIYADETRPRLQGLLTAWELKQEGIPCIVIADNAAGHLMRTGEIDLVITGADRIAKNGDFANKIGTYEKAVLAKENNIPFYVAAPMSTFDGHLADGNKIIIEEREQRELAEVHGKTIFPPWVTVRNPAFDVTPSRYVTGFITDRGIKKE